MSQDSRPLPRPPRPRFGADHEEAGGSAPLTADRMAQAAAAGRLEEFLHQEIPPGDHARNLAMLMMGMSGMMPPAGPVPDTACEAADAPGGSPPPPSPDILRAVGQGDVADLACLLKAEHAKRHPGAAVGGEAPASREPHDAGAPAAPGRPGIDAALVDELIRIAADADVTVDWLMLRAVRLYVEEFRRTGRL